MVAILLPLTGDQPVPTSPVVDQVIPIEIDENESSGGDDNRASNRELPPPSEPEEIVEPEVEVTPISDSPTASVRSSSSGGGGGGSSGGGGGGGSSGGNDDDEDSSEPDPGTRDSIEELFG
jgi:hypothetical protein